MLDSPKRRRPIPALAILFVAILLQVAVPAHADPAQLLHKHAPRFARRTLDGRRVDLNTFRDNVVLLTFWATWCTPCQAETPRFIDWQSHYADNGLQVVAVSMDDDPDLVRSFLAARSVNYPVLMGDVRLGRAYGTILGLPVNFLIDRHGNVAAVFQGETDLDTMESAIRGLLEPH